MERVHIEKTSKPLKLAQMLVVLLAMGSAGTGLWLGGDRGLWVGGIGCAVAFAAHCVVRLLMWWEYG